MNAFILLLSAACVATGIAAFIDFRTGFIPNRLTVPLAVVGIPAHVACMAAVAPNVNLLWWVGDSLLGIVICGAVPLLLWRTGGLGGGDMKLFAALGSLLGVRGGLEVQLVAFTCAAVIAPAVLAYKGQLMGVLRNTARIAINPFMPAHRRYTLPTEVMTEVRFGPAIFLGAVLVTVARLAH